MDDYVIDLPNYASEGSYTYTLQQVQGDTLGVTYFDNEIILTVKTDGNGNVTNVTINVGEGYFDEDENKDVGSTEIFNAYETGSLTIEKEVSGEWGDTSGYTEFTVVVELRIPNDTDWDGTVLVTTDDLETAKNNLENLTWPQDELSSGSSGSLKLYGEKVAEIIQLGTPVSVGSSKIYDESTNYSEKMYMYTFTISANETLTLWNLPLGIDYKVQETTLGGYNSNKTYTLSTGDWEHYINTNNLYVWNNVEEEFWDNNGNQQQSTNSWLNSVEGIIEWNSDQDEIIIKNVSTDDKYPLTGISLDSLPYILMLIAAAAGFVILLSGKSLRNRG